MREHAPVLPGVKECGACGETWPCAVAKANTVLDSRWKVVDNDLIGGKCIVTEHEFMTLAEGAVSFIDLIFTDEIAQHIVYLHNEWVDRQ